MFESRDTYIPYAIITLCTIVCGLFLYVYFVNAAVIAVVERKDLLEERNELRTKIALLETDYIESQHKVATSIAQLDGYTHESAKLFVARTEISLAYNEE